MIDLLRESVIVQACIALLCMGAVCYLTIVGREVPALLVNALMLILGFYFGSKTQQTINRRE